jgi:ribonuclease VapC
MNADNGDRHLGDPRVAQRRTRALADCRGAGGAQHEARVRGSLLEAQIVVRGREHPALLEKLERFLDEIEVLVTPFDETQARLAADTFQRYGKGQGHPAQLNMGDCAVYALAKSVNEPLLFVGNDFAQTDVEPC